MAEARRVLSVVVVAVLVAAILSVHAAGPANARPERRVRQQYTPAVVGGGEAPASWTFIAALIAPGAPDDFQGQFCGGALIKPTWVLTAAHCVESFISDPSSLRLVIGRRDLYGTGGDSITARSIRMYPGYDASTIGSPDIALVELSRPSSQARIPMMSAAVEPIWNDTDYTGVVAGWGRLTPSGNSFPIRLQSAELLLWSDSFCGAFHGSAYAGARHVCAGSSVSSACVGDSGGPLLAPNTRGEMVITGIVSYGPDVCTAAPGVFNQVSFYESWISSNTTASVPTTTTTTTRPRATTTTTTRPRATTTTTRPRSSTTTTTVVTEPMELVADLDVAQALPVPRGASPDALGEFTATLTGTSLQWTVSVSGLTGDATAVRIYLGDVGETGSLVVKVTGPFAGEASGTKRLSSRQLQALQSGDTYVNVSTARNRIVEIRGQISQI